MPKRIFKIYLTGDPSLEWQQQVKACFPDAELWTHALPAPQEDLPFEPEDVRVLLETAGARAMALMTASLVIGKTSEDPLCSALLNAEFGLARGRSPDLPIFLVGEGSDLDKPKWIPATILASEAHDSLDSALSTLERTLKSRVLQ
jgi:hypothetical protein